MFRTECRRFGNWLLTITGTIVKESNPADLPSRGLTLEELKQSQLWLHGPFWLRHGDLLKTEDPGEVEELFPTECLAELRARDRESLALTITEKKEARIGAIMSIECFSPLEKLIMSTTILLSFVGKLKQRLRNWNCCEEVTNDLKSTEEEKSKAESLWIREALRGSIKEDWTSQFMLYLDGDGVWRCGGRLGNSNLPYHTKYPILLPRSHRFTLLVVRKAHQRVQHSRVKRHLDRGTESLLDPSRASIRVGVHQPLCHLSEVFSFTLEAATAATIA